MLHGVNSPAGRRHAGAAAGAVEGGRSAAGVTAAAGGGVVRVVQEDGVGGALQAAGCKPRQAQGLRAVAVEGVGGSVEVADAFDELIQEGGVRGTQGAICTEQAVGVAATRGLRGHLGALRQVACLHPLGVVGPAHADSPPRRSGGAPPVGGLRRAAAGPRALEGARPGRAGAVGPAWSLGHEGRIAVPGAGMACLVSRHCPSQAAEASWYRTAEISPRGWFPGPGGERAGSALLGSLPLPAGLSRCPLPIFLPGPGIFQTGMQAPWFFRKCKGQEMGREARP